MANVTFTELPQATLPLVGTEILALVQPGSASGTSVQTTTAAVAALAGGSTTPFVVATANAAQSIGGTKTQLLFGSTVYDRDGNFVGSTFTASLAGVYAFLVAVAHDNTATAGDNFVLSVTASGGDNLQAAGVATAAEDGIVAGGLLSLNAGDTVAAYLQRSVGSGTFSVVQGTLSRFQALYLKAA